jgi:DNA-directed RNA polymerase specialized sigma24 family protein
MEFDNPLTTEQLEFLDPILHQMAAPLANCEADRLDLVQTAYLVLFSKTRNWTNPLVCSYSAMLDYIKKKKRWGREIGYDGFNCTYEQKDVTSDEDFRSLNWLDVEMDSLTKQAAIWHWIDGIDQGSIGATLGVSASSVSRWLVELKKKIKSKYKGVFN